MSKPHTATAPPAPAISILLPAHNAETTLEETLHSIQGQSWEDWELVAVDDGSSDRTGSLLADYAANDGRIRLLQPGRQGLVGALNCGLASARGALVARIDADDLMHPERLARQQQFMLQNPALTLAGCQVRIFPEEQLEAGFREYERWQNRCLSTEEIATELYVESPIAHPTFLFRRQPVVDLGGYRSGPFPEDYELLLRLHHSGHAMAKLAEVLVAWRDSPGRATRTDPRYTREAFSALRAAYLACDPRLHQQRPLAICGAGRRTRRRVDYLMEYGFRPCAYIDIDPRKIGNRIAGVPVVAPEWLDRSERPFVLGYVTNHGAREVIADQLTQFGYLRGRDYLMVG